MFNRKTRPVCSTQYGGCQACHGPCSVICLRATGTGMDCACRQGQRPDGICLVVGTVGSGFESNTTSDVIFTDSDLQPPSAAVSDTQIFWEAFPAGSGPTDRTTYMFSYMDAEAHRPSLEEFFDLYWDLMPRYQGVKLEDIKVRLVAEGAGSHDRLAMRVRHLKCQKNTSEMISLHG